MPSRDPARQEAARRFGLWLSRQLADQGMSGADLARRIGHDSSIVSKWRRGQMQPAPESCREIARALVIPHDEVLRQAGHRAGDLIDPDDAIRREIVALLPLIPDELLRPLPAMLRGLVPADRPKRG